MSDFTVEFSCPLGRMRLRADDSSLLELSFLDYKPYDQSLQQHLGTAPTSNEAEHERLSIPQNCSSIARECLQELDEYFFEGRQVFTVRLNPQGTEFQRRVWQLLLEIQYGTSISYRDCAMRFGDEKSIRALATANARNPIAIIIPCHRVISSDGSLRGYAGGLWRKEWLLRHEGSRLF